MTMNELITVIVPSCPSGFKPYPELTIEATVKELRIIATCLRAMERNSRPICQRLSKAAEDIYECYEADGLIYQAMSKALAPNWYITNHCLQDYDRQTLEMATRSNIEKLYTTLRSTWIDHIERSIWEQIGH